VIDELEEAPLWMTHAEVDAAFTPERNSFVDPASGVFGAQSFHGHRVLAVQKHTQQWIGRHSEVLLEELEEMAYENQY
jgi:hypothetical protein